MADFLSAFRAMQIHEGGWANDPRDPGGETYRGISRKYWPTLGLWKLIDAHRDRAIEEGRIGFLVRLSGDGLLDRAVEEFYRMEFWDKLWGDAIPEQDIADELFDTAVNFGVKLAVEILQFSLNTWNRDEELYDDIRVDGVMGSETLCALRGYLDTRRSTRWLLVSMNVEQGAHYHRSPNRHRERFMLGWFGRVTLEKAPPIVPPRAPKEGVPT